MVYFDPGKKSILRVYAVVFLTAVIHNVWNAHAVQKKKNLSVVGYRLACWLNIAVFASKVSFFLKHKHHVWRRGSSIEPTDSTPKGSEGISDVISKEISEAFSRENFVAQVRDRRNS